MLALTLMEFPTTVQFPVPTSRAPVTSTDEVNIVALDIVESVVVLLFTTARVLILPDPL